MRYISNRRQFWNMENNSLEKLVAELRTVTPFKETTGIGDVVLIASDQPRLILYGLITSMTRDQSKKDEWWHIGLTFFTVPLQKVIWTLRTEQMTGREIFTMGGEKRFFKAISIDLEPSGHAGDLERSPAASKRAPLKRIK